MMDLPLKRHDLYWYDDEPVLACLDQDVAELESENAELKARLAELDAQEPICFIDPRNLVAMQRQGGGALRYLTNTPNGEDVALYKLPIVVDGLMAILKRWVAYGEAMQKSGTEFPRLLIAETRAMLNAAPKQEQ